MLQSMVVRRCGILNLSVKETGLFDMFADITTAIKVYSSACHQSVQLSMPSKCTAQHAIVYYTCA